MARVELKVPFAEKDVAKLLGACWDREKKVWYVPDGVEPSLFAKWLPPGMPEFRVDLKQYLPFAEAVTVEVWGARWDNHNKVWYVPKGVDLSKFAKWLPVSQGGAVERLPRVVWAPEEEYITNIVAARYYIATSTQVCWRCDKETKIFGILVPPGHSVKDSAEQTWEDRGEFTFLQHILYAPPSVVDRIEEITNVYYYDEGLYEICLMPHCDHCGASQHDDEMYGERFGGFCVVGETEARRVTLYEVAEPFEGTYCVDAGDFRYTVDGDLVGLMRKTKAR